VLSPNETGTNVGLRNKEKGSYLRQCYTDAQLATSSSDATANAQRDSVLKTIHTVYWADAAQDDQYMSWVRNFYRDVHATTGGVPAVNGVTDGSYINYADVDLARPGVEHLRRPGPHPVGHQATGPASLK
jgi:aclacinomycin oxidase